MKNPREKILLIGSPRTALLRPDNLDGATICESILAGIEQAQTGSFQTIGVLLSSILGNHQKALQALRQSSPHSRIILLAEMLQEPMARELTGRGTSSHKIADDYLICPVRIEELLPPAPQSHTEPEEKHNWEKDYQERIRQLERLATEDDLTGLKNRRYLNQFLSQVLALARQVHFPVTLLLFDIDNFKLYNDQFGHAVGDRVLIQAGRMIRHCCRAQDVVARIGGDEFAVVFWDLPETDKSHPPSAHSHERRQPPHKHPREPLFMAERFRKEIAASQLPLLGPQGPGQLTISGGLASFPEDGKNAQELLQRADEALLEAKRQGKNQIIIIGSRNNTPLSANQNPPPSNPADKEETPDPKKTHPESALPKQAASSNHNSTPPPPSQRKKL